MLFDGVKLLVTNWRLTLVQVLPAMWIWLAMLDLKAHVLRGDFFHVVHGPVVVLLVLAVAAITAVCFFLNAVFAFAIAKPRQDHPFETRQAHPHRRGRRDQRGGLHPALRPDPGRPAASGQLRRCRARKHQARRTRPTRSPPAL